MAPRTLIAAGQHLDDDATRPAPICICICICPICPIFASAACSIHSPMFKRMNRERERERESEKERKRERESDRERERERERERVSTSLKKKGGEVER
jgi:hypothetical protein